VPLRRWRSARHWNPRRVKFRRGATLAASAGSPSPTSYWKRCRRRRPPTVEATGNIVAQQRESAASRTARHSSVRHASLRRSPAERHMRPLAESRSTQPPSLAVSAAVTFDAAWCSWPPPNASERRRDRDRRRPSTSHREALTDPALHAAVQNPHLRKTGATQDGRRTDGAFVGTSDRDDQPRSPERELADAICKIIDRDVHGRLEATERTVKLRRRANVENGWRIDLGQ
jgi:hypothetical protein